MQASLAIENVLSIGAEDAGTTRTSQATFDRVGNNGSDYTQLSKVSVGCGQLLFLCSINASTSFSPGLLDKGSFFLYSCLETIS